jgi:uncharacterized protein YraI
MRTPSCLCLFGVCLLAMSASAGAQNAVTTRPASVYAGPDDRYPMVAELDADAPVQVIGCLDDWSWCDVAFADNRGWLYAPDIIYGYEGGYVPLYTYAPSLGVPVVQFTIGDYWDRYYHGRPWYAQRDDWAYRDLSHRRRPAGPPPSVRPPPPSARVERPSHEAQTEQRLRLGSAEQPRQEAERRDEARGRGAVRPPEPRDVRPPAERDVRPPEQRDARPPDPRSAEHVAPPDPARESRPSQAERVAPPPHEEHPPASPEAPRREERALPPQRPDAAHHEEKQKPGDRPNDSPH